MNKKIDWLEQFAADYNKKLEKTASKVKIADQIIVDCSSYPDAKVGSLVDYKDAKYKVVDTDFHDAVGPGVVLEKLADGEEIVDTPVEDTVEASCEGEDCDEKECGDVNCSETKEAAKNEAEEEIAEEGLEKVEAAVDVLLDSDYPATVPEAGGVKPIPSAPIEGPGKKKVTDAPYHPSFDPGEQYAMDIPDDFEDAAKQTADIISQENAMDRTTVDGHYTYNQNIIINNIISDYLNGEVPPVEEEEEIYEELELPEIEEETEKEVVEETAEEPAEEIEEPAEEIEEEKEKDEIDKIIDKL